MSGEGKKGKPRVRLERSGGVRSWRALSPEQQGGKPTINNPHTAHTIYQEPFCSIVILTHLTFATALSVSSILGTVFLMRKPKSTERVGDLLEATE